MRVIDASIDDCDYWHWSVIACQPGTDRPRNVGLHREQATPELEERSRTPCDPLQGI
jgi:hypothetical protein